jgi:hypothetical protein
VAQHFVVAAYLDRVCTVDNVLRNEEGDMTHTLHEVMLVDKEGERCAEVVFLHFTVPPVKEDRIEDIAAPGFGPGDYEVVLRRHQTSRGKMYGAPLLVVRRL